MTPFQEKCIQKCKDYLESNTSLKNIVFDLIEGKTENYYFSKLEIGKHLLEIFIYSDEAGCMVDNNSWIICERPDYKKDDELIEAFIKKLSKLELS